MLPGEPSQPTEPHSPPASAAAAAAASPPPPPPPPPNEPTASEPTASEPMTAPAPAPAPPTKPGDALASDINGMQMGNASEAGEDVVMKDRLLPKVKQVSKCVYCERNSAESLKTVPCLGCGSRCHIDCIRSTAGFRDKILVGDDFFHFKCDKCTDGNERFRRYHLSWVDVVHITLFNLTHNPRARAGSRQRGDDVAGQFSSGEHGPQEYGDGRVYFHYKADVARFIDQNWGYFWTKSRGETWINSASSALSTNSTENVPEDGRFESGKAKYNKNGMWALTDDLRFPASYDSLQQQKTRTVMYSFAEDGSLIELRAQSANGRRKRRSDAPPKTPAARGSKKARGSGSVPGMPAGADAVAAYTYAGSKRGGGSGSRRVHDSEWSIPMWPDIDNPPGPAHMSREETHAAAQFVIESDRRTVWNDKGYRMAKASHGVEEGAWYFEAQVLDPIRPEFNLRIGWSQISGELQAPCGFDAFSYSMRAKPNTRFHVAIGSPYGEEYGPGDTIGVLIYLPQLDADERQDLAVRKWRPGQRYRQFTYSRPEAQRPLHADSGLPPLPVLAGSELVYFKNGKCLGPAFQKLYLGKYYPAISSYMGGKVCVNLGSDFKFPPPPTWHDGTPVRPISDLEFAAPAPEPSASAAPESSTTTVSDPSAAASEPVAPKAETEPAAPKADAEPVAPKVEPEPEPATTEAGLSTESASVIESAVAAIVGATAAEAGSDPAPMETDPAPMETSQPPAETGAEPAAVEPAVEAGVEPAVEAGVEPAVEPTVDPAVDPAVEPASTEASQPPAGPEP